MTALTLLNCQGYDQGGEANSRNHYALQNQTWYGRCLSSTINLLSVCLSKIKQIALNVLYSLSLLFSNTYVTASILKKLHQNVLPLFELLKGIPDHYAPLKKIIEPTYSIINTLQIAEDVDYFVKCKFNKDSILGVTAKTLLTLGHIAEGLTVLARVGLISLSLGKLRLFNWVPYDKTIRAMDFALSLGPAFFAGNVLSNLAEATDLPLKKKLSMEFAKHLADLTLSLMIFSGNMSPIALGIAGMTCIGFELSNLIFKVHYEYKKP